ncbi:PQQ-dependent sugar dehydrogenase [Candidatus Parcubacteria bacterium]|nr:PQQ-dependent sugar dehydrogenase [Candidatus Parcubacteria bacterium]
MKKIVVIVLIAALGAGFGFTLWLRNQPEDESETTKSLPTPSPITSSPAKPVSLEVEVVAENLNIPWDIAFLPNQEMLVTERGGRLIHISKTGEKKTLIVDSVKSTGESGLLGIILHPRFTENHFVYLYITHTATGGGLLNRVERYVYENNQLTQKKTIISNIPGALYHDGGRMEFGPDGFLYITTGDATKENLAQDKNSLAGKILRLNDDGTIPSGNPFNTAMYSFGHRNPQGLTWDPQGNLWSTEHGRSGVLTGYDELNLITAGSNYGWPTIQGPETKSGLVTPVLNSGSNTTWAPASALYWDGSIFFGGLLGESLYEAKLQGNTVTKLNKYFFKEYGRIRTVRLGPDGMFYMTTSNHDGRGKPKSGDDKILRVNPARFR